MTNPADDEDCVLGNSIFVKDCALLMVIGHSIIYVWSLYCTAQLIGLLDTDEILTAVGLYLTAGTILASAFYGTVTMSSLYFRPFIYLQGLCYWSLFSYELYQFSFTVRFGTQFYLHISYLVALAYGSLYCLYVSNASLDYFNRIQMDCRGNGREIGVFRQQIFGTLPIRRYDPLETPRASIMSDTFIDDIFDDYSDSVKLE